MNNINFTDDNLKKIIRQSTIQEPSVDFTDKLMQRIQQNNETYTNIKEIKIKYWFIIIPAVCVFLIAVVGLTFYFSGIDVKSVLPTDITLPSLQLDFFEDSFKNIIKVIVDAVIPIYTGIIAMLLLTIDMLIRRQLFKKGHLR